MPTILTNGIQLPDKGSVDWYSSMQSNYNLIDTHLGDTNSHVTIEDKSRWDSKANASHTHTSSELTDIGDFATKSYVDTSINGLVDSAPATLDTLKELSTALNDDANFASTVTTALGAKANSADLATVATSGSYTDLNNKPSIPTKTSDLTNDSNFVDTSNSAVASGITSAKVTSYDGHITDTDIHVTTADKIKWNNGVSQAYVVRYASVAVSDNSSVPYTDLNNTDNIKANDLLLDTNGKLYQISSVDTANETVSVTTPLTRLALDADVLHRSGNEDVNDIKTFKDMIPIDGDYLGNEASTNQRTNICLRANRDTADKSAAFITRFRQNRAQGALQPLDLQKIGFDVLENEVRTNNVFDIQCTDWLNDVPQRVNFVSSAQSYSWGRSTNKSLFNELNPGALSLPDLDNGIDISGYFDATQISTNTYTALADGYISLAVSSPNRGSINAVIGSDLWGTTSYGAVNPNDSNSFLQCMLVPILKNQTITVYLRTTGGTLESAKFYPCLGNV